MSVTSLELYVPIKLDKPRKFKLTIDDMTAIYEALNAQPTRKTEITGWTIHNALGSGDWPAWDEVLSKGLKHQDPKMEDTDEVHGILRRYVENGGDMEKIGRVVRRAMMLSGALPKKIWEKVDAKKWREDQEAAVASAPALDEDPAERAESTT